MNHDAIALPTAVASETRASVSYAIWKMHVLLLRQPLQRVFPDGMLFAYQLSIKILSKKYIDTLNYCQK